MPPLHVALPLVVGAGFIPARAPEGRQIYAQGASPGKGDYDPGISATGAGMMFQVKPDSPSGWV